MSFSRINEKPMASNQKGVFLIDFLYFFPILFKKLTFSVRQKTFYLA